MTQTSWSNILDYVSFIHLLGDINNWPGSLDGRNECSCKMTSIQLLATYLLRIFSHLNRSAISECAHIFVSDMIWIDAIDKLFKMKWRFYGNTLSIDLVRTHSPDELIYYIGLLSGSDHDNPFGQDIHTVLNGFNFMIGIWICISYNRICRRTALTFCICRTTNNL